MAHAVASPSKATDTPQPSPCVQGHAVKLLRHMLVRTLACHAPSWLLAAVAAGPWQGSRRAALVASSAGGWISRIFLGRGPPYSNTVYHGADRCAVCCVLCTCVHVRMLQGGRATMHAAGWWIWFCLVFGSIVCLTAKHDGQCCLTGRVRRNQGAGRVGTSGWTSSGISVQ